MGSAEWCDGQSSLMRAASSVVTPRPCLTVDLRLAGPTCAEAPEPAALRAPSTALLPDLSLDNQRRGPGRRSTIRYHQRTGGVQKANTSSQNVAPPKATRNRVWPGTASKDATIQTVIGIVQLAISNHAVPSERHNNPPRIAGASTLHAKNTGRFRAGRAWHAEAETATIARMAQRRFSGQ